MIDPLAPATKVELDEKLALVRRAMVAVSVLEGRRWPVDFAEVDPAIARALRELKFPGATHRADQIMEFASTVDRRITSISNPEGMTPDVCVRLESLAKDIEGRIRPGSNSGGHVFGLPGWWLAACAGLADSPRLRTGNAHLAEAQEFLVDGTGLYCLEFEGREHEFGGGAVLPLSILDSDADGGNDGHGMTARFIVARAGENWQKFVAAARETRVYRAMRRVGQDDVRTALWLSRRGPRRQLRRLQFAEHHPEFTAQILPEPGETALSLSPLLSREAQFGEERMWWFSAHFHDAWESVDRNMKPRDIGRFAWSGRRSAKSRLWGGNVEERVAAQAVASNRLSLLDAHEQLAPSPQGFVIGSDDPLHRVWVQAQPEIMEAWEALDGGDLRDLTWRQPRKFLDALAALVLVYSEVRRFVPASLLVRSMLRSGVDAAVPWAVPGRARDLHAAVGDAFRRSILPQFEMAMPQFEAAGYHHVWLPCDTVRNRVTTAAAREWLTLRFGLPEEQRRLREELPGAAREAQQRPAPPCPKWRDLTAWSQRWHHPPRRRRGEAIATGEDFPQARIERAQRCPQSAIRFGKPLVLDAGGRIGANMRRVGTTEELRRLAMEEGHCIDSYAEDLRRGDRHCLVIEHEEGGRKARSTILIEERTRWVKEALTLERSDAYRLEELRMRGNAASPPEHWQRAKELVEAWCAIAAQGAVQASAEEAEHRRSVKVRSPMSPDEAGAYWTEITSACAPEWFLEFDPAQGLIAKLIQEYWWDKDPPPDFLILSGD